MAVIAMVRLTATPGQRDALLNAMEAAIEATREHPNCHGVEVLGGIEGGDDVLLVERWTSVEDHQEFINGVMDAGGLDGIMRLLATEIETLHYTLVDPA